MHTNVDDVATNYCDYSLDQLRQNKQKKGVTLYQAGEEKADY